MQDCSKPSGHADGQDIFSDGRSRKPPAGSLGSKIALGLALAAVAVAAGMKSTVAGESQVGEAANAGDPVAIMVASYGFAAVVLLGLGAVLAAVDPVVTNRGRALGIAAISVAIASPLLGSIPALVLRGFSQ